VKAQVLTEWKKVADMLFPGNNSFKKIRGEPHVHACSPDVAVVKRRGQ
jgi:hypothetical protein